MFGDFLAHEAELQRTIVDGQCIGIELIFGLSLERKVRADAQPGDRILPPFE